MNYTDLFLTCLILSYPLFLIITMVISCFGSPEGTYCVHKRESTFLYRIARNTAANFGHGGGVVCLGLIDLIAGLCYGIHLGVSWSGIGVFVLALFYTVGVFSTGRFWVRLHDKFHEEAGVHDYAVAVKSVQACKDHGYIWNVDEFGISDLHRLIKECINPQIPSENC